MSNIQILKRLYKNYKKKFLSKIILSIFFSILVAVSTSAIAYLLDPAIEKIFIEKNKTLMLLIPIAIVLAFTTKGISLYIAKVILVSTDDQSSWPEGWTPPPEEPYHDGPFSGFFFIDADDHHIWAQIGTEYHDSYYPCMVTHYSPKQSS